MFYAAGPEGYTDYPALGDVTTGCCDDTLAETS